MANLSPSLLLPWGGGGEGGMHPVLQNQVTLLTTHTSPSKQESTDCFKHALRNDYRGTTTKGLIVHCR